MAARDDNLKQGKVGSRGSVKKEGETKEVPIKQTFIEPAAALQGHPGPFASVGMSLSMGSSTEFARQKLEVSAWCTLPSLPDTESIAATYDLCKEIVFDECKRRTNEAVDAFFPELRQGG